jgi:hypothetical protein
MGGLATTDEVRSPAAAGSPTCTCSVLSCGQRAMGFACCCARFRGPTIFPGPDTADLDGCEDPTVVVAGGRTHVWYTGYNQSQRGRPGPSDLSGR